MLGLACSIIKTAMNHFITTAKGRSSSGGRVSNFMAIIAIRNGEEFMFVEIAEKILLKLRPT